jgi:hypothetical protein
LSGDTVAIAGAVAALLVGFATPEHPMHVAKLSNKIMFGSELAQSSGEATKGPISLLSLGTAAPFETGFGGENNLSGDSLANRRCGVACAVLVIP